MAMTVASEVFLRKIRRLNSGKFSFLFTGISKPLKDAINQAGIRRKSERQRPDNYAKDKAGLKRSFERRCQPGQAKLTSGYGTVTTYISSVQLALVSETVFTPLANVPDVNRFHVLSKGPVSVATDGLHPVSQTL